MRTTRGCNPLKAAKRYVWGFEEGARIVKYMNCPSMFLPQSVLNFDSVLDTFKEIAARPLIQDIPTRYLKMFNVYRVWKSKYARLARERAEIAANVGAIGRKR